VSVGYLYVFLEKILMSSANILIWIIHFLDVEFTSLHILDTNALSDTSFANIFSHSEGCLLVLLVVYFTVQKFLF